MGVWHAALVLLVAASCGKSIEGCSSCFKMEAPFSKLGLKRSWAVNLSVNSALSISRILRRLLSDCTAPGLNPCSQFLRPGEPSHQICATLCKMWFRHQLSIFEVICFLDILNPSVKHKQHQAMTICANRTSLVHLVHLEQAEVSLHC